MVGIYKISNNKNDNVYIGQSIHIFNRFNQHYNNLLRGKHHSEKFQTFFNENDDCKLSFEILEMCKKEMLNERESYWIKEYDAIENGFNMGVHYRSNDKREYNKLPYIESKRPKSVNTNRKTEEERILDMVSNKTMIMSWYDNFSPKSGEVRSKFILEKRSIIKDQFSDIISICGDDIPLLIHGHFDIKITDDQLKELYFKIEDTIKCFEGAENYYVIAINNKGDELRCLLYYNMVIEDSFNDVCYLEKMYDYHSSSCSIEDLLFEVVEEYEHIYDTINGGVVWSLPAHNRYMFTHYIDSII